MGRRRTRGEIGYQKKRKGGLRTKVDRSWKGDEGVSALPSENKSLKPRRKRGRPYFGTCCPAERGFFSLSRGGKKGTGGRGMPSRLQRNGFWRREGEGGNTLGHRHSFSQREEKKNQRTAARIRNLSQTPEKGENQARHPRKSVDEVCRKNHFIHVGQKKKKKKPRRILEKKRPPCK